MDSSFFQIFILIATVFILLLISNHVLKKHQINIMPINWPILGMLPHLILNVHQLHDWLSQILQLSNGTFHFKGPWFSSMEAIIFTSDPSNVHYVMSKNFSNFPKGEEFYRIFDILGGGIFNTDFDEWRYQRKTLHSFLTHSSFLRLLSETVTDKVEKRLIPILESTHKMNRVMDLEDLFKRLGFDIICNLVMGIDPISLSVDLPDALFCKAMDETEEALLLRHIVPECIWKLQRWVGIGSERRLRRAWKILDGFIYNAIAMKRQEMRDNKSSRLDLLTLYMMQNEDEVKVSDKLLRDMSLNLLVAGRDSTSTALTWFFFLIHKNPRVETKIQQELKNITNAQEIGKLVYLHGALCETLRLYPSVPFQHKSPIESDTLPSGQRLLRKRTKIIFSMYAMGRSESIWGEDCLEFKPERWITDQGRIKHHSSFKFLAFNAGPRTCLGKDIAFIQMKLIVASVILHGYQLQVIDEHTVEPVISVILHTKHGLKVKVLKTNQ